jgi:hypothetical protein
MIWSIMVLVMCSVFTICTPDQCTPDLSWCLDQVKPKCLFVCSHLRQVSGKDFFHEFDRLKLKHWWLFINLQDSSAVHIRLRQKDKIKIERKRVMLFDEFVAAK